jgi:hypothetical protein
MNLVYLLIAFISIIAHNLCNAQSIYLRKRPQPCPLLKLLTKTTLSSSAFYKLQRGPLVTHWHKEMPHFHQQFGSELRKHSEGDQDYLWTIVTYYNMMLARTRQGSITIKKIEELCLINEKKNDKIRKQQEEEEK